MCHRLILMFPHVCKEFYPEFKDESATARAGNMRTEFLGRRSLASFIPPGYVVRAHTIVAKWTRSCMPACTALFCSIGELNCLVRFNTSSSLTTGSRVANGLLLSARFSSSIRCLDTLWDPKRSRQHSPAGSSVRACGFWPSLLPGSLA